jgi:hypothetical protein
MITTILSQPECQLGNQFTVLLGSDHPYARIIFVSAFTALKTILRLREGMLAAAGNGAIVRLTLGIDLGGTSRDVLEELLQWDCEVFVYHNPIPRATFHPKIYLFERQAESTLFLGSNNLTDGGLYTNYEAATRYDFTFPADIAEYERLLRPIRSFLDPVGPTVRRLDAQLIESLSVRGALATEIDDRRSRRGEVGHLLASGQVLPPNPFSPVAIPLPPLLSRDIRNANLPIRPIETPQDEVVVPNDLSRPEGVLVWRKVLPRTDALQVRPGSHHVGGVRLTQAEFDSPSGHRIDQTTYFRVLFDDYDWEPEPGGHADQEHTFVPMRIVIRGHNYDIRNFEISHKPSGEAGQDNYTTTLRWGRNFNNVIQQANLTNAIFSLYETPNSDAPFFIEITDQ